MYEEKNVERWVLVDPTMVYDGVLFQCDRTVLALSQVFQEVTVCMYEEDSDRVFISQLQTTVYILLHHK